MASQPQFDHPGVEANYRAGLISADGVGVPQEYPKMLYKKGDAVQGHILAEKPIAIDNRKGITSRLVNDADEEAEALAGGWFLNPSLELTEAQKKDAEIAALKAELANKPGKPAAEVTK